MRRPAQERADDIVQAVLDVITTEGYDAVQVRTIARRAAVSLSTIYKLFGTRDALLVAAIRRWMAENMYAPLDDPPDGLMPYETLQWMARTVLDPWRQNPRMLEAFWRARLVPGGDVLESEGNAAAAPLLAQAFDGADPAWVGDVALVCGDVLYAAIGRFASGEIQVTDIVPALDRALGLLIGDTLEGWGPTGSATTRRS